MKKFAGNRPLAEIIANAKTQGVDVDDYNYRVLGYDYVAFGVAHGKRPDGTPMISCGPGTDAWVLYTSVSGRFFGRTDKGVDFSSDVNRHEREPWFQALLSFFYTEEKPPTLFKAVEEFVDAVDKGGKATAKVRRTKGGLDITLKAKKGQDLRGVMPALSGLYKVDSSDGGAY